MSTTRSPALTPTWSMIASPHGWRRSSMTAALAAQSRPRSIQCSRCSRLGPPSGPVTTTAPGRSPSAEVAGRRGVVGRPVPVDAPHIAVGEPAAAAVRGGGFGFDLARLADQSPALVGGQVHRGAVDGAVGELHVIEVGDGGLLAVDGGGLFDPLG